MEGQQTERPERAFLSIDQLAALTPWTAGHIRVMIHKGILVEGVHFFRPLGQKKGRPVFSWKAVVAWIEGSASEPKERLSDDEKAIRAMLD